MANPTNKTDAAQPDDTDKAADTGKAKSAPTGAQSERPAQPTAAKTPKASAPAAAKQPRAAQDRAAQDKAPRKEPRREQGAKTDLATLRITYVKSVIGYSQRQRATIRGLGLRRLHQTVEHRATPEIRGMVNKVSHLVRVEEVAG
jgi:large subunit ribosomal protein L30